MYAIFTILNKTKPVYFKIEEQLILLVLSIILHRTYLSGV